MELLTIRESSLGTFVESVQEAILQGYRHSQDPARYAWLDNQFNAVLERAEAVVEYTESDNTVLEPVAKKLVGRPARKPK